MGVELVGEVDMEWDEGEEGEEVWFLVVRQTKSCAELN